MNRLFSRGSSRPLVLLSLLLLTHFAGSSSGSLVGESSASDLALFAHKSVDQAWKAAVTGRKPLLVMFTSDHCVYCKKMLKQTYGHPGHSADARG